MLAHVAIFDLGGTFDLLQFWNRYVTCLAVHAYAGWVTR